MKSSIATASISRSNPFRKSKRLRKKDVGKSSIQTTEVVCDNEDSFYPVKKPKVDGRYRQMPRQVKGCCLLVDQEEEPRQQEAMGRRRSRNRIFDFGNITINVIRRVFIGRVIIWRVIKDDDASSHFVGRMPNPQHNSGATPRVCQLPLRERNGILLERRRFPPLELPPP